MLDSRPCLGRPCIVQACYSEEQFRLLAGVERRIRRESGFSHRSWPHVNFTLAGNAGSPTDCGHSAETLSWFHSIYTYAYVLVKRKFSVILKLGFK
jgi:hypothetical protein